MDIFIDESGIHKQTGHSTTTVVYIEVKNLEKFERKLLARDAKKWFNKLKKSKKLVAQFLFETETADKFYQSNKKPHRKGEVS